jgi:hypothetical protein
MQAGDAIAAPLHWYYNIDVMKTHLKTFWGCDQLRDYSAVPKALRNKHPDSWNYMKSFDPDDWVKKTGIDIVHEKKPLWTPGSFYHSELEAGEVTHTVKIANLLTQSIAEDKGYDYKKYLERYLAFWQTPGQNNDTYIEIVHRHFHEQLAAGHPSHQCGMDESCLSGFTVCMPLVLAMHQHDETTAAAAVEAHLRLTHNSDSLAAECEYMGTVVRKLLSGAEPKPVLAAAFSRFFEELPVMAGSEGKPMPSIEELAAMSIESLFVGEDPYAKAGEPGCARFSLR